MTQPPPDISPRRIGPATIGLFVSLLLIIALPALAALYVDLRWFRALGFEDVFTTILTTRIGLGAAVGVLVAALLFANMRVALRLSVGLPTVKLRDPEGITRVDLGPLAEKLTVPVPLLVGVLTGVSASRYWEVWLKLRHGVDFGTSDPILGYDAGFYIFTLPGLIGLKTLALWVIGLCVLGAGVTHFLRGGIQTDTGKVVFHPKAKAHLSVLASFVFVALAVDAWLAMPELMFSNLGPVNGASYADVHARIPALRVQMAVAGIGAVLVAVSATRRRFVLGGTAVVLYLAVELLGVRVYPSLVHRFSVEPNEAVKEVPFIAHNIEATRFAYGLDEVVERDLSGELTLTAADIEDNHGTIDNVRLWDHRPLLETFAQIQEIRTYYEFQNVDNDRYMIDGELRQTMLSPRELASNSLENPTWINTHLTYTHGYGIALGPVNQSTTAGLPVLYVQDIPPVSSTTDLEVTRPAIYFGELTGQYAFVETDNDEFDHPSGDDSVFANYEGTAGIRLDSSIARTMVSIHLGTMKLLLSDDIDDGSRVLLHRNVAERVATAAPFLALDADPYMVVRDDGTLAWIQDAYTTTTRYPYSQRGSAPYNYIRNSVKAVVDAYDGTVELYVAAPDDPLLRTWRAIFPSIFKDLAEMPEDLRRHLRYPEDLFAIQTEMFSVYHMNTPDLVYSREDQWEIPVITSGDASATTEPYYTVMRLPEEQDEEFILMLPFTPARKQNLAAWMVARNDGDHLGELVVYSFPNDRLVFGPGQIMNRINQDAEISRQVSLWDQRGSQAVFGTLLVIPVEESLIYVTPLYLRSSGEALPELKRVIAVYENRIAMEMTLEAAVTTLFGAAPSDPESTVVVAPDDAPGVDGEPTTPPVVLAADPPMPLNDDPRLRASQLYERAVAAQRTGDWAAYGARLEELGAVLAELRAQAQPARPEPELAQPEPEPAAPQGPGTR